ncbi:hypothetical protein BGW80DRAFT_1248777 [Lactifluus volemus]|nr:hypothetical protein BGW80DRAFT_1248777 [Lactifluus volemus]
MASIHLVACLDPLERKHELCQKPSLFQFENYCMSKWNASTPEVVEDLASEGDLSQSLLRFQVHLIIIMVYLPPVLTSSPWPQIPKEGPRDTLPTRQIRLEAWGDDGLMRFGVKITTRIVPSYPTPIASILRRRKSSRGINAGLHLRSGRVGEGCLKWWRHRGTVVQFPGHIQDKEESQITTPDVWLVIVIAIANRPYPDDVRLTHSHSSFTLEAYVIWSRHLIYRISAAFPSRTKESHFTTFTYYYASPNKVDTSPPGHTFSKGNSLAPPKKIRKTIVAPMALEPQVEEGRREVYDGIELALSVSTVLPSFSQGRATGSIEDAESGAAPGDLDPISKRRASGTVLKQRANVSTDTVHINQPPDLKLTW